MLEQANVVRDFFNEFNLYQLNRVVNADRNTYVLDLVFSTMQDVSTARAAEPLCACDRYHPVIEISLPLSISSFSLPER